MKNKETSCGVITFYNDKVLIIKHIKGHYDLPKGHIEGNETKEETAIREIKEETGIDAIIDKEVSPYKITYSPKENIIKDVYYFIGSTKETNIKEQIEEVSKASFIEIDKALELLTYQNAKDALKYAIVNKK